MKLLKVVASTFVTTLFLFQGLVVHGAWDDEGFNFEEGKKVLRLCIIKQGCRKILLFTQNYVADEFGNTLELTSEEDTLTSEGKSTV